jgi:hypothetical protein
MSNLLVNVGFKNGRPIIPLAAPGEEQSPGPGQDRAASEAVAELLAWVIGNEPPDPTVVGRRILLLAYSVHFPLNGIETHRDLARILGVCRQRVSQQLAELRSEVIAKTKPSTRAPSQSGL